VRKIIYHWTSCKINIPYSTSGFPVEVVDLSKWAFACVRRSRIQSCFILWIVNLNDTQVGVISIDKLRDDNKMALLDHKDIKRFLIIPVEGGKMKLNSIMAKFRRQPRELILRKNYLEQQRPICFLVKCLLISMI
jgi:hypothetical protein